MEEIIKKGIEHGLIALNDDKSRITYYTVPQSKSYRYTDPEEKVRAVVFLQLIFDYGYPINRIQLEVQVPRRTPNDWADIAVFNDDECKSPYIVVECKHKDVSEQEFIQAIEQGFGNANSLKAHYLVVTSIIKKLYYNVADFKPMERITNRIPDIPHFGEEDIAFAKYYMIIRNRTTKFSGVRTGQPDFFTPFIKITGKRFGGYNQNDYLCSAFIK